MLNICLIKSMLEENNFEVSYISEKSIKVNRVELPNSIKIYNMTDYKESFIDEYSMVNFIANSYKIFFENDIEIFNKINKRILTIDSLLS